MTTLGRIIYSAVLLTACNAISIPKLAPPGNGSSGGSSGGSAGASTGSVADTTPPTGAITPASGASLPDQQILTLSFSETISRSTLVLGGDLGAANPSVAWLTNRVTDDTATITGTWPQGPGKTLTVDYEDLAGNAGATISATYTVTDAPSVLTVTPTRTSVLNASARIVLVYSKTMDTASAKLGGVLASAADAGTWSTTTLANDTLTIAPSGAWVDSGGVQRTLTVDATGANALAAPEEALSYAIDTSTPAVSTVAPTDNATINGSASIVITFNEPVTLPATLTNSGTLGAIGTALLSSNGTVLTITPATSWTGGSAETLVLPVTITNLPGTPIALTTLHYTADVIAPTLTPVTPTINGATIDSHGQIVIDLSEPIDTNTQLITGSLIAGALDVSIGPGPQLLISPQTKWQADSGQTLNVTVKDLVGNTSATLALTFEVLDNVVYVDNTRGSDAFSGTHSKPKQTLTAGLTRSHTLYPSGNTSVYVAMSSSAYTTSSGPFSVPANTMLIGGFDGSTWSGPTVLDAENTTLSSSDGTADPAITVALLQGCTFSFFTVLANTAANNAFAVSTSGATATPVINLAHDLISADAVNTAHAVDLPSGAVTIDSSDITASGAAAHPIAVNATSGNAIVLTFDKIVAGSATTPNQMYGVFASGPNLDIESNDISVQASATNIANGLSAQCSGTCTIAKNYIHGIAAGAPQALIVTSSGTATVTGNSIDGGIGQISTHAVSIASTAGTGVIFEGNAVTGGAGNNSTSATAIDVIGTAPVRIDNNLISGGCDPTAATCMSTGIEAEDAATGIYNNTIHEGFATQGSCIWIRASGQKIENNLCFFSKNQGGEHVAFLESAAGDVPSSLLSNEVAVLSDATATSFEYGQFIGGGAGSCLVSTDDDCFAPGDNTAGNPFFDNAGNLSGINPAFASAAALAFDGAGHFPANLWLPTNTTDSPGPQDGGTDESARFNIDFSGNPRPSPTGNWSIGAYQYGP